MPNHLTTYLFMMNVSQLKRFKNYGDPNFSLKNITAVPACSNTVVLYLIFVLLTRI